MQGAVTMVPPPSHPFNPLLALRAVCAVEDRSSRRSAAVRSAMRSHQSRRANIRRICSRCGADVHDKTQTFVVNGDECVMSGWGVSTSESTMQAEETPAEELHALRIRAKRLRYALEIFQDLYGRLSGFAVSMPPSERFCASH